MLVTLSLSYSKLRLTKAAGTLTGYEPIQLESSLTHCLQRQIPSYVRLDSVHSVTEIQRNYTQKDFVAHCGT